MENGKESAFPFVEPPTDCAVSGGLTKREYFAAMAMQGILAAPNSYECTQPHIIANDAVLFADALLAKLAESESSKPLTQSQQFRIKEVTDAYVWIRQNNQSISDDALDLMKNAAIAAINKESNPQP